MQVAVAQIESALGDLDANLRKHLDTIDAARAAGVEVLLFPELSLTGHGGGPRRRCGWRSIREHPIVVELARASGPMCTVFGAIEEAAAAQFYNAAFAVRDGTVASVHRKINLATYGKLDDGMHFAAGGVSTTFALRRPLARRAHDLRRHLESAAGPSRGAAGRDADAGSGQLGARSGRRRVRQSVGLGRQPALPRADVRRCRWSWPTASARRTA